MSLYFDANSSTPIDPRVLHLYEQALKTCWGNPSSVHSEGQKARSLLSEAREICARLFHVLPRQILFFSSATEALNTLLFSFFKQKKGTLLTTEIEHAALFEPCLALERLGQKVLFLPVGREGSLVQVEEDDPSGIATFLANNETGVVTDVASLSAYTKEKAVPFLIDGVAVLGKMKMPLVQGVHAFCFSSHKVYAPKGVGLAVLSKECLVEPLLFGGRQESGRRAGTENVPALWAFAKALEFLFAEEDESIERQTVLRDAFEQDMLSSMSDVCINGVGRRVCNVSNLFIEGVEGEELLMLLDQAGVAIGVGAACSSGALEPSRVITKMYSRERALASIRISLHKWTSQNDVEQLLSLLKKAILRLRR